MNFNEGPIVAISTASSSKAALGIVRVSGFESLNWLYELTKKSPDKSINPRYCYFSKFYGENDLILDEGLFTYFKGPKSFTGENLVEFSLHGNPLLLERFVEFLNLNFGFALAKPGEFSYRALKNKKLNLTQIEGLDLILNANSGFGLNAGTQGLNNELYESYMHLRKEFLEIRACIELLIDFAEDVGEEEIQQKLKRHTIEFYRIISNLNSRVQGNLSHLLTPQISLIGATNAGKSTLFNKLLKRDRAIVSEIHGTTRDYISEYLHLGGHNFQLVDTAGLRDTDEQIERIGIEQSLKINRDSFFKILVINPFAKEKFDKGGVEFDAVIFTHSDLPDFESAISILKNSFSVPTFVSGSIGANSESGPMGANSESGPMGAISELENYILLKYQSVIDLNPIPIKRHRDVISSIYNHFNEFSNTYDTEVDLAILSSSCHRLGREIDELMGIVSSQEVLDHIFENFCIGK